MGLRNTAESSAKNWIFELTEPVLDVEVSLLAAPGAHVDWVHGPRRDEAVRAIVERCASVFETDIKGRVEHVRHSNFNHHGMTVYLTIAAPDSPQLADVVNRELGALERTLEARLQSHFGWEQAAVSVQIEPHASYIARTGTSNPKVARGNDITVFQPPGGSNAIAPVIVTVPQALAEIKPIHALPYPGPGETAPPRGGGASAGLLGALIAMAVVLFIAIAIGPLTNRIGALYEARERDREHYASAIREGNARLAERNNQIRALQDQNGRLNATISRLASRRGHASSRWDQPPTTLPDTDQVIVGSTTTSATTSSGPIPAAGAP
jgi:hypothetical protein